MLRLFLWSFNEKAPNGPKLLHGWDRMGGGPPSSPRHSCAGTHHQSSPKRMLSEFSREGDNLTREPMGPTGRRGFYSGSRSRLGRSTGFTRLRFAFFPVSVGHGPHDPHDPHVPHTAPQKQAPSCPRLKHLREILDASTWCWPWRFQVRPFEAKVKLSEAQRSSGVSLEAFDVLRCWQILD